MVLVERVVDRRHLALTERVVERVVDRAQGQAEAHRGVAIDRDVGLQTAHLLIGIDVLDDFAGHQRLGQLRRPRIELRRVVGEQRILIGRVALSPAGSQIGDRDHEQPRARDLRQLGAQPGHDLVGGDFALGERLQRRVEKAGVGRPSAREADDAFDRGVLLHDVLQLGELGLHRLKGDALIGLDRPMMRPVSCTGNRP